MIDPSAPPHLRFVASHPGTASPCALLPRGGGFRVKMDIPATDAHSVAGYKSLDKWAGGFDVAIWAGDFDPRVVLNPDEAALVFRAFFPPTGTAYKTLAEGGRQLVMDALPEYADIVDDVYSRLFDTAFTVEIVAVTGGGNHALP